VTFLSVSRWGVIGKKCRNKTRLFQIQPPPPSPDISLRWHAAAAPPRFMPKRATSALWGSLFLRAVPWPLLSSNLVSPCQKTQMSLARVLLLPALLALSSATPPLVPHTSAPLAPRVSVNMFDAWYNRLPGGHGRAVSLQHMSDACSSNGFTIIRVAAAPFWPVDAKLLTDDAQQVRTFSVPQL
jgi:hypothetical protein